MLRRIMAVTKISCIHKEMYWQCWVCSSPLRLTIWLLLEMCILVLIQTWIIWSLHKQNTYLISARSTCASMKNTLTVNYRSYAGETLIRYQFNQQCLHSTLKTLKILSPTPHGQYQTKPIQSSKITTRLLIRNCKAGSTRIIMHHSKTTFRMPMHFTSYLMATHSLMNLLLETRLLQLSHITLSILRAQ